VKYNGEQGQSPPTSAKLNLAILEARKAALVSDTDSKFFQYNHSVQLDLSLTDDSVFELFMMERNRELAELEAEIAKERAAAGEEQGASAKFVVDSRLSELRKLSSGKFDFRKLVRLCEEVDTTHGQQCYFATAMLTRALLDHVPPIFGKSSFDEVANDYEGRSFKGAMQHLQNPSPQRARWAFSPTDTQDLLPRSS
jgi:hypothetical protein